jgi:hypothetical protein
MFNQTSLSEVKTIARIDVSPVQKVTKDMIKQASLGDRGQARALVKIYYQIQDQRLATSRQQSSNHDAQEPNDLLQYLATQFLTLEKTIKRGLEAYVKQSNVGNWLLSVYGIGPVISAAIIAHIDITKAPTAGHIWSYAGILPGIKWEKGQKRPWNADLKVVLWKAGCSFMKFAAMENCAYGHLYRQRKDYEWKRNLNGGCSEDAFNDKDKYSRTTESWNWVNGCYLSTDIAPLVATRTSLTPDILAKLRQPPGTGMPMLPPAQIDARARRWVVRIFISHVHHVMYIDHYAELPPKPFAIAHLNHAHEIKPSGFAFENGKFVLTAAPMKDEGFDDVQSEGNEEE